MSQTLLKITHIKGVGVIWAVDVDRILEGEGVNPRHGGGERRGGGVGGLIGLACPCLTKSQLRRAVANPFSSLEAKFVVWPKRGVVVVCG